MNNKTHNNLTMQKHNIFLLIIILSTFMVGFSIAMLFVSFGHNPNSLFEYGEEKEYDDEILKIVDITYVNLTNEEKEFFNSVFQQIKKDYLYKNDKWIITKNMSEYCDSCTGQNYGKGDKIIIKYEGDEEYLKKIITHEVIHSYIYTGNETHKIVYDIANYMVAFK